MADDLVAVSLLSVAFVRHTSLYLLEAEKSSISTWLEQTPCDLDLHDATRNMIERDSGADKLWRVLYAVPGVGEVSAAKLLARKRPRLLPIYDRSVRRALGLRNSNHHWTFVYDQLQRSAELTDLLDELRGPRSDGDLSVLRVLDVLLWMSESWDRPPA